MANFPVIFDRPYFGEKRSCGDLKKKKEKKKHFEALRFLLSDFSAKTLTRISIVRSDLYVFFFLTSFGNFESGLRQKKSSRTSGLYDLSIVFCFLFFFFFRRIHESLEESRRRRSVRRGRTISAVGLGGVGRRQIGAGLGRGQTSRVQSGRGRRAAVRHARAPATGPAVSARHSMLPDDHHQQGQHNDDSQRRGVKRGRGVSVAGRVQPAIGVRKKGPRYEFPKIGFFSS